MSERVDITPNIVYAENVVKWRLQQVLRAFPDMPAERAKELAEGPDHFLLEKVARLGKDCPLELAYRILR
jgi:hypothetical protein